MASKKLALTSFILSLLSWIPLFNFFIAPAALFFGIKAIIAIKQQSENHSGKIFAVIGIIIGGLVTFFTYSWLIITYLWPVIKLSLFKNI